MKLFKILIFLGILSLGCLCLNATASKLGFEWEKAIVTIEASGIQYDFRQPWNKQPKQTLKSGVLIRPREILTTAEGLDNLLMARVQKGGESKWWEADVKWIDYHANLALLSVRDEKFYQGMKPAQLCSKSPDKDNLHVVRWKGANLETRKVEFAQYIVDEGVLSGLNCVQMELETIQNPVTSSEIIISDGKVAAITTGYKGENTRAIPAVFIRQILNEQQKGKWHGLGYFAFWWQPSYNPNLHEYLKLSGEPRGVVVIYTPDNNGNQDSLKPLDIILEIDGFQIDNQGNYKDPDFGKLILENLAVKNKFAGDVVSIKVWRNGAEHIVKYTLPKFDFSKRLVPQQVLDKEPEYIIAGGLVFQPLTEPYLRSFGAEWRRSAPFRLVYLCSQEPTKETPSLVVLSGVLPDPINIGYYEYRGLVVESINGLTVRTLKDVKNALKHPKDGYHVVEFQKGDGVRRLVIDALREPEATKRILARYGIQSPIRISE